MKVLFHLLIIIAWSWEIIWFFLLLKFSKFWSFMIKTRKILLILTRTNLLTRFPLIKIWLFRKESSFIIKSRVNFGRILVISPWTWHLVILGLTLGLLENSIFMIKRISLYIILCWSWEKLILISRVSFTSSKDNIPLYILLIQFTISIILPRTWNIMS